MLLTKSIKKSLFCRPKLILGAIKKEHLKKNIEKMQKYLVPLKSVEKQSMPFVYYNADNIPDFISQHWGQRKLLLTEIFFLSSFCVDRKVNVIYAGAAPGNHFNILCKLFPNVHFDLIDPEKWNDYFIKLHRSLDQQNMSEDVKHYKISNQVNVYHGFMSDGLAHKLCQQYNKNFETDVLFISDIRPTNIDSSSSCINDRDNIIQENQDMQLSWYKIIKSYFPNAYAMFKFKPSFIEEQSLYLKGDLYYQPWAPLLSAEMRLITNSLEMHGYDNKWLEEHLFWYNMEKRNKLTSASDSRLNDLWDTQYEYEICKLYCSKSNRFKDPISMMFFLSKNFHDYFRGQNKGKEIFENGHEVYYMKKLGWINSIVKKNQKYV